MIQSSYHYAVDAAADKIASRLISVSEARSAIHAAVAAATADSHGDAAARGRAMVELWNAVGYWRRSKAPSVAEFRGEAAPPKMLRMPRGRSVPWTKRWSAVLAWAAQVSDAG